MALAGTGCLSARGLHLRRCERRRRPSATAEREPPAGRPASRATAGEARCGSSAAGAPWRFAEPASNPSARTDVRAALAATWCVWWCRRGACGRAGPGPTCRAQRAQVWPVQCSGGGVAGPSAIAPRDVSARARRPGLIEPRGQRLQGALLAAAGARVPLLAWQWPRGMAQAASLLVRMALRSACWVSFSGAAQGGSHSEAWSSLPWATQAGGMASATVGGRAELHELLCRDTAGQEREREGESCRRGCRGGCRPGQRPGSFQSSVVAVEVRGML